MKEDFVTYDLAVKLKEKGYPQNGDHYYNERGNIDIPAYNLSDEDMSDTIAPEIHEVLKWLRKKKNLSVEPYSCACGWRVTICKTGNVLEGYVSGGTCVKDEVKGNNDGGAFDWFEQAALAGIEYVIDNLI